VVVSDSEINLSGKSAFSVRAILGDTQPTMSKREKRENVFLMMSNLFMFFLTNY